MKTALRRVMITMMVRNMIIYLVIHQSEYNYFNTISLTV